MIELLEGEAWDDGGDFFRFDTNRYCWTNSGVAKLRAAGIWSDVGMLPLVASVRSRPDVTVARFVPAASPPASPTPPAAPRADDPPPPVQLSEFERLARLKEFEALPEAKGRLRTARALAVTPGVTVEQAAAMLAACPIEPPAEDRGPLGLLLVDGTPYAGSLVSTGGGKPLDGGEAMSADEVAAAVNREFGARRS